MKKGTNKETVQGLLDNTWDSYPPEFYITFHPVDIHLSYIYQDHYLAVYYLLMG